MDYPALSVHLETHLKQWRDARRNQELKFIDCYSDYMRITREDDTKGVGAAKSKQARGIFVGSSRNKVRAARAKILDSMFGANQFPFDTEPVNEELKEWADTFETIISQQLEDMEAEHVLRNGVDEISIYGTAFLFGPFAEQKTRKETQLQVDPDTGARVAKTVESTYPIPRYDLAQTIDVYPDPSATNEQKGLGIFWASLESPEEIRKWRNDPRYHNVDEALKIKDSDTAYVEGKQYLERARQNINFWYNHESNRIRVARYFGSVPAYLLAEADADQTELEGQYVEVMAIVAAGVCVRCEKLPWNRRPAARCVYEEVAHEMWGVGVVENNAPQQKMTNAAVRLFFEAKGHSLLPMRSVDKSKFLPSEDFRLFPGKAFQFKSGLTPDERNSAIMFHNTPDVSNGWLDAIKLSEDFSDNDTGITKYTQGNDSSNLNKTAHGISMIMGASSLPLKEVLQNVDAMWIERIVSDLVEWDLEFLDPEHVAMIHGDEIAQKWAEIKQYGQAHFMKWKATGASSFMAKEVLLNKLMGFAQLVDSSPIYQNMVDPRELLEQIWDLNQIGRESPILKDDDLTMDKLPPQVQQHIQQLQMQAEQGQQAMQHMDEMKQAAMAAIEDHQQTINKLTLQLADKDQQNQIKAFEAETGRIQVVGANQQSQIDTIAQLEMAEMSAGQRDAETAADQQQDMSEATEGAEPASEPGEPGGY